MSVDLFVVNVQVALFKGNSLLLIGRSEHEAHAPGILDLPGGKVELIELGDEAVETAARRELSEETGVEFDGPLHYVTSALFVSDDGIPVINLVFKASISFEPELCAGRDETACFWVDLSAIADEPRLPPWVRSYIDRAVRLQQT